MSEKLTYRANPVGMITYELMDMDTWKIVRIEKLDDVDLVKHMFKEIKKNYKKWRLKVVNVSCVDYEDEKILKKYW